MLNAQAVTESAERVEIGDILKNIRNFLKDPKNIKMTASLFFLLIYETVLCVMVYNLAPTNVPAYKATLLPTLFLAMLPTLYTWKLKGNSLSAFVVGFLTLTGVASQATISRSFSGYSMIVYLCIFSVLMTMIALRVWNVKLKKNHRLVAALYWTLTAALAPAGIVMKLALRPINGASCWLYIGNTSIQLTEILKLLFVAGIVFAVQIAKSDRDMFWKTFFTTAAMCLSMLFVNEGGTIIVAALSWLVILFFCIDDTRTLLKGYGISLGCVCASLVAFLVIRECFAEHDTGILGTMYAFSEKVIKRIEPFIPLYSDNADTYQIDRAMNAFRIGRLFGSESRYIHSLPEGTSDFVLASIAARFGVLIVSLLILAFVFFFMQTVRAYRKSDDGTLLIISSTILFVQATTVILSNLGIIPVVGITLPLISNGGSSCIVSIVLFTVSLVCMGKNNAVILREENIEK